MGLVLIWVIFIVIMSLGALGEGLDTFHYLMYSFIMLYILYIFKQL
jgi:hypothetical protein